MTTTNHKLTADTITDDRIRSLRADADAASDLYQVSLCDRALYGTQESPSTILSPIDADHLSAEQVRARQMCAAAINAARAQGDSAVRS